MHKTNDVFNYLNEIYSWGTSNKLIRLKSPDLNSWTVIRVWPGHSVGTSYTSVTAHLNKDLSTVPFCVCNTKWKFRVKPGRGYTEKKHPDSKLIT